MSMLNPSLALAKKYHIAGDRRNKEEAEILGPILKKVGVVVL